METFNLSDLDVRAIAQEGVDMPLIDPAGRRTAIALRVRGTDCAAYNDTLKEHIRRGAARAPRKTTEEERNSEFWELHATLLAGWSMNGQPVALVFKPGEPGLEYSPKNAAKVLEDYPFIFEQVRRFADNRANFLPGLASSS